jgi:hypothetical protein
VGILLGILVIHLSLAYLKKRNQKAIAAAIALEKEEEAYYAKQWLERKRQIEKSQSQRQAKNKLHAPKNSHQLAPNYRYGGTD